MKLENALSEESPTKPSGQPPRDSSICRWWKALCARWSRFRIGWEALMSARLTIIVALLIPVVFIWVDQASEVLRCLAESQLKGVVTPWGQIVVFIAALLAACIHGWYFTRALFSSKFVRDQPALQSAEWIRKNVPRVLGVIPAFGLAVAFWNGAGAYASGARERTIMAYDGIFCVVMGGALWAFFVARRVLVQRRAANKNSFLFGDRGTPHTVLAMAIATTLTVGAIIAFPVGFPQLVGTGAILLFAAATLICYGSLITYFSYRFKFPFVGLALLLAAIFSQWNDNHKVRTLKSAPAARIDPAIHFQSWYTNLDAHHAGQKSHPVFIVAAEGGGIRAAYWTATILSALQDSNSAFGSHVYAISGVSGGSVGGAVFTALLADGVRSNTTVQAQDILSRDFLSPPLAAMLFPDFVQRFLPYPFEVLDRARALEKSWEDGWKDVRGNDRFARPFTSLWESDPYLPSLFLNGTSVESGKRIITSNVGSTNLYLDSEDACDLLDGELRLSTAAHMSARFTYVSPAGRFTNGQHVVDGGYFENSGAVTACEVGTLFRETITNSEVYVILINNSPTVTSFNKTGSKRHDVLSEVLAPIQSMLHTREARGSYAKAAAYSEPSIREVIEFTLETTDVPLPLGWQLSRGAANEMNRQLSNSENSNSIVSILAKLPNANVGKAVTQK